MPGSPGYPALLDAYLAARYRNQRTNRELRVGDRYPDVLPASGCVHAQLSACNPASNSLSERENQRRTRQLADQLNRLELGFDPGINCAADGSWPEQAFWIENIDCRVVDQLASQYGQNACLVVGPDALIRLRLYLAAWHRYTNNDPRLQGLA